MSKLIHGLGIKKDMDVENNKYPAFWKVIRRDFKEKNINYRKICEYIEVKQNKTKQMYYNPGRKRSGGNF